MAANPALNYAEIAGAPPGAQTLFSTPDDVQRQPSTGVGCIQPHVHAPSTLIVDADAVAHVADPLVDFVRLCAGLFGEGGVVKVEMRTWGDFFRFTERLPAHAGIHPLAGRPLGFVVFAHPSYAEALLTCLWGDGGNRGPPTLKLAEVKARLPAFLHQWFDRRLGGMQYHAAFSGPTSAGDSSRMRMVHDCFIRMYFPVHPLAPNTYPSARDLMNLDRELIPTDLAEAVKCLCTLLRSIVWDVRATEEDIGHATREADDDSIKTPYHKALVSKANSAFTRIRNDRVKLNALIRALATWDGAWDTEVVHFFPAGFAPTATMTLGQPGPNVHLHNVIYMLTSAQQARIHLLHQGAVLLHLIPANQALPIDNAGAAAVLAVFVDQADHEASTNASEVANMAGIASSVIDGEGDLASLADSQEDADMAGVADDEDAEVGLAAPGPDFLAGLLRAGHAAGPAAPAGTAAMPNVGQGLRQPFSPIRDQRANGGPQPRLVQTVNGPWADSPHHRLGVPKRPGQHRG